MNQLVALAVIGGFVVTKCKHLVKVDQLKM
jgi:hypothetical protein